MKLFDALLDAAWLATQSPTRFQTNDTVTVMLRRVEQRVDPTTTSIAFEVVGNDPYPASNLVSSVLDLAVSTG